MHGHHSLPRIERYTFELKLQSTSFTAQQQTHVLSAAPEQAEPNYSGLKTYRLSTISSGSRSSQGAGVSSCSLKRWKKRMTKCMQMTKIQRYV